MQRRDNIAAKLRHRFALVCCLGAMACSAEAAPTAARPVSSASLPIPASAAAVGQKPAPADAGKLPMHPWARIYSLLDVQANGGSIELRLGVDQGGGTLGTFRYVPLVAGKPDFSQETPDVMFADTTGVGFVHVAGGRPDLWLHVVSGFRSGPSESYQRLAGSLWDGNSGGAAEGLGNGIFDWGEGRLLESRRPMPVADDETPEPALPSYQVLRGKSMAAPSLPPQVRAQLLRAGFAMATELVMPSGEVVAVGHLEQAGGFATLVWTKSLTEPAFLVTPSEVVNSIDDLEILGGSSLQDLRLRAGNTVMKWSDKAWVVESTIAADGLPDVWFGRPLLRNLEAETFARMSAAGPWLALEAPGPNTDRVSSAIDADGVVWRAVDDNLYASKPSPSGLLVIDEETLVAGRKKSILRGGSNDATGEPPQSHPQSSCRMHYVMLAIDKAPDAPKTYPKIFAALKGRTDLAGLELFTTRESDLQFLGVQFRDEKAAKAFAASMRRAVGFETVLCAEPSVAQRFKVSFSTGTGIALP